MGPGVTSPKSRPSAIFRDLVIVSHDAEAKPFRPRGSGRGGLDVADRIIAPVSWFAIDRESNGHLSLGRQSKTNSHSYRVR
jgi:hypothetical protein